MDEITTCTAAVDSAVKVWNAPSEPVNPAMPKGRFVPHYCLSSVLCWRQEMAPCVSKASLQLPAGNRDKAAAPCERWP